MTPRTHNAVSLPISALVATAVLWSTGGVLIKLVSWNPLAIAGVRSAISALLILGLIRKPKFRLSLYQIGGAVSFSATVILFVSATKLTTAANAILLQYTAPVYTALFARRFLNEHTSWFDWIIIAVVLGGIALFFLDDLTLGGYYGNVLALIAGVAHGWIALFLRKQKDVSTIETFLLGNLITAAVGVPFMFSGKLDISDWLGLAFLGIFQLGFSTVLYAYAIRRLRALDAMLIFMIEPVLNPIWVYLVIGESPGRWALAGGVVVIASVTARSFHALRRNG
jgi:drug/metabolite transporter (DMT)-like permease